MTSPVSRTPIRDLLRSLPVFATELPRFDADAAPPDPVDLFERWLLAAIGSGVPEPHAMGLATVDDGGRPSSRVLICKDVDAAGRWYFASGAGSRKGRELARNPHAALTFHWPLVGRQIRIRGPVTPTGAERSAADFLARAPGSRAESLVGRQSDVLDDPAEVDAALRAARDELVADPGLVAAGWTLYALHADDVEFWQADAQRRHTRLRYERGPGSSWARLRLWP